MKRLFFVILVLFLLIPASVAADADKENQFAQFVNEQRIEHGVDPLPISDDLVSVARAHSEHMYSENDLHHNPSLADEVSGWSALGENVGRGQSVDLLNEALMESDGHRAVLLDKRWTDFGVGVYVSDNLIWVTQVYRESSTEVMNIYTDIDDISSDHLDAVIRLHHQGLMIGREDGSFGPKDTLTREQFATVIDRILN